jgi:hypothetical protein
MGTMVSRGRKGEGFVSGVRDMLGDFGQEIQGMEHLKIARRAGVQFLSGVSPK